jgi:hypothetical protein
VVGCFVAVDVAGEPTPEQKGHRRRSRRASSVRRLSDVLDELIGIIVINEPNVKRSANLK